MWDLWLLILLPLLLLLLLFIVTEQIHNSIPHFHTFFVLVFVYLCVQFVCLPACLPAVHFCHRHSTPDWGEARQRLLGAALPRTGGSLFWSHHSATPAGNPDPGPPGSCKLAVRITVFIYGEKNNRFMVYSQMHVVYPQSQLHNLSLLMDKLKRSPGCLANGVRPNTLMNTQEALHPGEPSASRNSFYPLRFAFYYSNNIESHYYFPFRDSACEELSRWLCFDLL